jgi:hypothetical protein
MPVYPPPPRPTGQDQRLGGLVQPRPQRTAQHLRHPHVALDLRRGPGIGGPDGNGGDQVGDGPLDHVGLAERGQDAPDVGEKRPVGADHQHAAAQHPARVRVEQVGHPVQPDRGLPGPRRTLHAQALVGAGPDDVVLVRLDRRHDVAHRARPRPLDLLDEDAADRARRPSRLGELLVLIGGELGAGEPEPAPPRQAHRVGRAGPVEGPGHRRAPVDDDRVAIAVMDVTTPDVQPFARQRPRWPVRPAALAVAAARRFRRAGFGRERPGIHNGAFGVVEPPKEERDVRDVAQGLRPVVQIGLEVLLRDPVSRHRLQPEHVLAHQPQELTGAAEVVALGGENGVRPAGRAGQAGRGPGG